MAGMQAVQSSGDAHVAVPRCTVVSGQIDLKTGGEEGDPDEKAKHLK